MASSFLKSQALSNKCGQEMSAKQQLLLLSFSIHSLQTLMLQENRNSSAVPPPPPASVPGTPRCFKVTMGTFWVSIMKPLKSTNYKTSETFLRNLLHTSKWSNSCLRFTLSKVQKTGHTDVWEPEPPP